MQEFVGREIVRLSGTRKYAFVNRLKSIFEDVFNLPPKRVLTNFAYLMNLFFEFAGMIEIYKLPNKRSSIKRVLSLVGVEFYRPVYEKTFFE